MRQHCLGNLITHSHHRIERGHWLLKDHADSGAADVAHLRFRYGEQLFSAESNVAANASLWRQQPQNGQRAARLPRDRLPHKPQHLARRDLKAHIADRGNASLGSGKLDSEISDFEQRGHTSMLGGGLPHPTQLSLAGIAFDGDNYWSGTIPTR